MNNIPQFGVSDFVAVFNQTLEYAYPNVIIIGELANYRISKNRWVYFDLKDNYASLRFFGSVRQLPGPLEEGMVLRVSGAPRLHPQFGFSINVAAISLEGEGSIKKAAKLLEAKLAAEGLFANERKRVLPYPPARIGLITSGESAAYADFVKILNARWGGVEILHADVQVQGEQASGQITGAIEYFNAHAASPDVIVIIRGGGSTDDLQTFSTEVVTRAVAGSRVPTLVAIGHEVDISLAELAADVRASTPSNAAELLVPDKKHQLEVINAAADRWAERLSKVVREHNQMLADGQSALRRAANTALESTRRTLAESKTILGLLSPEAALARGYGIVRRGGLAVTSTNQPMPGDEITVFLLGLVLRATIISSQKR